MRKLRLHLTAVYITYWLSRQELSGYLPRIGREKALRLERFHRDADFLRGLLGELLVRNRISERTGLAPRSLVFATGESGKPYLTGHPHLHFNLSHSGSWVVCAIDEAPIGIDVEEIRPVDPDVAGRFFTASEQRLTLHGGEAARLDQFFTLWTLKESYVKMTGQGVSLPLNEFSINRTDAGEYAVHTQAGRVAGVYPATSDRLVRYKLAVCGHNRPRFENLEILQAESLLRE